MCKRCIFIRCVKDVYYMIYVKDVYHMTYVKDIFMKCTSITYLRSSYSLCFEISQVTQSNWYDCIIKYESFSLPKF